jgi:hypothetical protein
VHSCIIQHTSLVAQPFKMTRNYGGGLGSAAFVPTMMIPQINPQTESYSSAGSRRRSRAAASTNHPYQQHYHHAHSPVMSGSPVSSLSLSLFNDEQSVSSFSSFSVWISSEATSISDAAAASTSTMKEFEPITDWTALGTFASIMFVFILLVRRTQAVERAVMEREASLELVRTLKSKALSSSDDNDTTAASLEQALERYEAAVVQEEQLRTIVPGVRIVPPTAGSKADENAAMAAKQFLGKDFDIGIPKQEENPSGKLPMVALGILAVLGVSLTGLLILLSMDPTTASSLLNDL